MCTGHTCGHRALVPPSRSLSIWGGNKHTNGKLKVLLWDSGSDPSVFWNKGEDNDHAAGLWPSSRALHSSWWTGLSPGISSTLWTLGSRVCEEKYKICQESPTEDKEKEREMSSFYLLFVPFSQTQGKITQRQFVQQFAFMRKCISTLK